MMKKRNLKALFKMSRWAVAVANKKERHYKRSKMNEADEGFEDDNHVHFGRRGSGDFGTPVLPRRRRRTAITVGEAEERRGGSIGGLGRRA